MRAYIIQRVFILIFLILSISTIVFFLIHLIPGDPAISIVGQGARGEDIERIHRELNLDRPLISQYLEFLNNLVNLRLGESIINQQSVINTILPVFPNTVYLALVSMLLGVLIALPLGVVAALKETESTDLLITFISSGILAIPSFFLGPLLIIVFSIKFRWLPVSGSDGIKHLILPAVTLGISAGAYLTRIVKSAIASELNKPYVLLAKAKGLSQLKIINRHILKNALIPIITTGGLQIGGLLTGSIITETVFSWHGIGYLLINSIKQRDYPMVQGIIVFITTIFLTFNFLIDIAYFFIDPRIKHGLNKG